MDNEVKEPKVEKCLELPVDEKGKENLEEIIFDENDDFYIAPAVCNLMHYRTAAMLCGILEVLLLTFVVFSFFSLQLERRLTELWMSIAVVIVLVFATLTTCLMIYGILTERPNYLWPQMRFMKIEIFILICCATVAILSMSLGIDATHRLFGLFFSVHKMEDHFGPIWPFSVAILAFFGAAITNWFHIIVRGAYDFLLDKEYFTKKQNIELTNQQ